MADGMNALIWNSAKKKESTTEQVSRSLVNYLQSLHYDVELVILREKTIDGCHGCFSCWLQTPGNCIINDDGADLPRQVIQSDLVFLVTDVTFGMYSSELKKAMDRFPCPLLLPFFKRINGEIHHAKRYEIYPRYIAFGVLPSPDQESENIFKNLVSRNAINTHTTATTSIIYTNDSPEKIQEKIKAVLSPGGAR
jgi:multimeric flavodoxin WrbA